MAVEAGKVSALWRFPVKSMRGERVDSAFINERGLAGDRAYALLDVAQDKVVTAKNLRLFPGIFRYRASFVREPSMGEANPPVAIELPDGRVVASDDPTVDQVLSASLGREVRLIAADPDKDQPHHDASPVSVLTNATLAHLRRLQPQSDFDVRRFRMNIIIDGETEGFPENGWIGRELQTGPEVRLFITEPNARCVMTTLSQDELPEDRSVFSALVQHNRLERDGGRRYPCAGVYAKVLDSGVVNVGDVING